MCVQFPKSRIEIPFWLFILCILGRFQLIIRLSLTSLKAIASCCSPTGNQPAGKITSQITLHSLFLCIMQTIQSMNFENCAKGAKAVTSLKKAKQIIQTSLKSAPRFQLKETMISIIYLKEGGLHKISL